jgi:hypothetical protein
MKHITILFLCILLVCCKPEVKQLKIELGTGGFFTTSANGRTFESYLIYKNFNKNNY